MKGNEREKIRHLLIVEDGKGRRTLPLQEATYSIGRDPRNSIVLHSKSVSRQHAILLRVPVPETEQSLFRLIDGSLKGKRSTNGLFINGHKSFSHDLKHGDIIEFGPKAKAKYYAISNLSDSEFSQSCEAENISDLLSNRTSPFETLIVPHVGEQDSSEAALARLASFPELIPNPIIEIDLTGAVTYSNPSAVRKFPKLKEAGIGHPILAELPSTVRNREENSFARQVEVGGEFFEQSVHYLPESDLIRIFLVDITERKLVEKELRQRDRLLQAVAEATNHLLTEMDYDAAIAKALAALGQAAEVDRTYIVENHPHPDTGEIAMSMRFEWSRSPIEASINQPHWQNQPYGAFDLNDWHSKLSAGQSISGITREFPVATQELLNRDKIKSLLLVPIQLSNEFWGYIGFDDCYWERRWSKHEESALFTMAASVSGALERQQTEEMIRYRALHDRITGLPNRTLFDEQLTLAIPNANRSGKSLAVMFLDLDRFKTINDTLGHTVGDQLLKEVAQRLTSSLRAGDLVARWGGDEFTVLLPRVSSVSDVTKTAQRILEALDSVFHLEGHELYVTASIGIALFDDRSPDAETLIKHADAALYQAKEQGKNNYQFYTAAMGAKAPELLALEKSLRQALKREEFMVCYQPRVDIATGKINGMEALLRWQHPEMGLVSPAVFIPIAEEMGLIVPIGEWVLRTACAQNKAWQDAGLPSISMAVNLSPKQFRQPGLVKTVTKTLAETGLQARFLELEITESTAIQNLEFTKTVLKELNDMGVHLSIDDFGTGHSSLSRLQLLPLHHLKIDQSFVRDLTTDGKVAHIVKAVVTLGKSLGLSIVAEGVENYEQLEFLKSIKCETVQGFLLHRPLSSQRATEVLQSEADCSQAVTNESLGKELGGGDFAAESSAGQTSAGVSR